MRIATFTLLALIGSLAGTTRVFGLGGTLTSPSLSVAASSGRDGADWIKVLSDKKYKFVVGDFINSTTNLYYAGGADSLSAFLADLAAVPGTEIQVTFSKESKTASSSFGGEGSPTGPCQWQIQHLGFIPTMFNVTIYLGDGKIDISKLSLPVIRSAPSSKGGKPAPAAE
jgi:hypothetical protein